MDDRKADVFSRLSKACSVFYSAFFIPVYVLREGQLVEKYPVQQEDYRIPYVFIKEMEQAVPEISYFMTPVSTYFAYFRLPEKIHVYIGPVGTIPYTDELMKQIWRYYQVPPAQRDPSFYRAIPPHPINEFLAILNALYYMCTGNTFDPESVFPVYQGNNPPEENNITDYIHLYMVHQLDLLDENYYNNSYEIEQVFVRCIENGDTESVRQILRDSARVFPGRTSGEMSAHIQNIFITTIAVFTRAAIRGGLDTQIAFALSDAYLQQMNRENAVNSYHRLMAEAFADFTNRVHQLSLPPDIRADLLQCVQYINRSVTRRITVADVADYIGYSRQYISKRFKAELGCDLGRFILNSKLTEAQNLLRFSEKSLSEISALLCFSSQSHFQRCFKAQFGMTPLEFRRQAKKNA